MERSAFEALMLGVNLFVFIIALTAGILLMSNIIQMVDYANQNVIVGMEGSLAESVGIVHERTYTGYQILNYYKKIEDEKTNSNFYIQIDETGNRQSVKNYILNNSISNYMYEIFELNYIGKEGTKDAYVFLLKSDDTDN